MTTTLTGAIRQTDETTEVDVVCDEQGPLCQVLFEWTDDEAFAETTAYIVTVPLKIVFIVLAALIVNRLLRRGIRRLTDRLGTVTAEHGEAIVTDRSRKRAEERATTVGSLLRSLSTAIVYGIALVMMLDVLGLSIGPIIASAGVLGLAIGFGAQSVVEDLLRGVFMLVEDQFGVGDRIDVGTVTGTVERVTLRTTVIRDADGTLWHVPNSEIDRVANETQQISRASVDIGISYQADIGAAIDVLASAAEAAADDADWRDHVTAAPEVTGVEQLGDDAVVIRVVVWVDAGERAGFERRLRRQLKEALDAAGIEMPNRQLDVWMREPAA